MGINFHLHIHLGGNDASPIDNVTNLVTGGAKKVTGLFDDLLKVIESLVGDHV